MFQDGQLFPQQTVAGNVGYPLRLRRTPRTGRPGGSRSCSSSSACPASATGAPPACPAASGSGSRWPVRWPSSRGCCCSTSRSRRSTGGCGSGSPHDLRDILVAAGTTALLVTHDQEEAFAVADRMALMRAGQVVQSGTVDGGLAAPGRRGGGPVPRLRDRARRCGRAPGARRGRGRRPGRAGAAPLGAAGDADGPLPARVSSRADAPRLVRLTVDVAGVGEVHAWPAGGPVPGIGSRRTPGGRSHPDGATRPTCAVGRRRHRLPVVKRRAYTLLVGSGHRHGGRRRPHEPRHRGGAARTRTARSARPGSGCR